MSATSRATTTCGPDVDGSVRRLALAARCGGQFYPSLSLAMLARLMDLDLPRLYVAEHGLDEIRLGDITIPVDQEGMLRVRYLGGSAAMPDVEATDILEHRELPHSFKDKAVFDQRIGHGRARPPAHAVQPPASGGHDPRPDHGQHPQRWFSGAHAANDLLGPGGPCWPCACWGPG